MTSPQLTTIRVWEGPSKGGNQYCNVYRSTLLKDFLFFTEFEDRVVFETLSVDDMNQRLCVKRCHSL